MAKAKAEITLSRIVDIASVTRYYKLQASTAATPAKPTAAPPSDWTTTEPSYTSSSTQTLYCVELTRFTNGTWSYSEVSKSSSYEAAKAAYTKANAVEGELKLYVKKDANDQIVSMINASASQIALNSNRLTINSDNFTLAADGTVTATAGEIAGFKLKSGKVNGLTQHSLLGGYESNGKQYGLRLLPQSGTDEWNSAISFINGSATVNLEAVRRETGEGFQELCITGAPVHAANGLRIGNDTVADFIVAQGTSGSWYYRKWASGWAECWSGFSPSSSVGNDKYIGISFPFTFKSVHTILTTSSSTRSAGQYGTIMTSARSVGNSGCQLCQTGTSYSNVYVQVYVGGTIG